MKVIGLTGGIATGKSTVARMLAERHRIPVLDADKLARQVVAPGTSGLKEVVAAFGQEILTDGGALDRPRLRRIIMADPDARRRLEAITHPRIRRAITDQLATWALEGEPIACVEAALLVETGSWRLYDQLVVVAAEQQVQIDRVLARDGGTAKEARAILQAQLPLADKVAVAHHVIHNDGDREALAVQVDRLVAHWRDAFKEDQPLGDQG